MCAKNNNNLFAGLSNNGASKLMLAAIFAGTLPVAAAEFAPTLGADSAYELVPITQDEATENSVKYYSYENGEIVTHYYNIQTKSLTGLPSKIENTDIYDIDSDGVADDVTGNFIGLSEKTSTNGLGAAIFNRGEMGNIKGHFIENNVTSTNSYVGGGAVMNYSSSSIIKDITGDFINNKVVSESSGSNDSFASGAAIFNNQYAEIDDIKGDFIGNTAISKVDQASGAAITNNANAVINSITGNFIKNVNIATGYSASGSAIFNSRRLYTNQVN